MLLLKFEGAVSWWKTNKRDYLDLLGDVDEDLTEEEKDALKVMVSLCDKRIKQYSE